jgi:hypothetical protein
VSSGRAIAVLDPITGAERVTNAVPSVRSQFIELAAGQHDCRVVLRDLHVKREHLLTYC